jgi:hypothetical protein
MALSISFLASLCSISSSKLLGRTCQEWRSYELLSEVREFFVASIHRKRRGWVRVLFLVVMTGFVGEGVPVSMTCLREEEFWFLWLDAKMKDDRRTEDQKNLLLRSLFILFYFNFYFIHMCIQCLGHFFPLLPPPCFWDLWLKALCKPKCHSLGFHVSKSLNIQYQGILG